MIETDHGIAHLAISMEYGEVLELSLVVHMRRFKISHETSQTVNHELTKPAILFCQS